MKKQENKTTKRKYTRPTVTKVAIDNEISMVMMSFGPGGDPGASFGGLNPLKWWR